MGSICGWSGTGLGSDMSQQAIWAMLNKSGKIANTGSDISYDNFGALGVGDGLHASSLLSQDSIRVAITGSPTWSDQELAAISEEQGAGAALIKAWRTFGKNLLSKLHGPFSLVIQDGGEALIAIDRIGIHSLSYALQDGVFVFSTSTGDVTRHPLISRRIDPQAIFNYIYFYDIPGPGTIFVGVEKLLPAQYVHFRNGQLEKGFYWKLHYDEHNQSSFQTQKQKFHELLRQSVAAASQDGSVATFLSGGTDSSTITGILAELQDNPDVQDMANSTVKATVDGYVIVENANGDEIRTDFNGSDMVEIVKPGKK